MYKKVSMFRNIIVYKFSLLKNGRGEMKKIKIPGKLIIFTGGMGGGKTNQLISETNIRTHNLNETVLAVIPNVAVRESVDGNGCQTKARSGLAIDSKTIPYDNPFEILDLAKKENAAVVSIADSHMFLSGPIESVVFGLLNEGRDVYLDCLKYDFGGQVFPVLKNLIHAANNIHYFFKQCDCQQPGDEPKGYYNQLIINTLFKKRKELLDFLKSKPQRDPKLIYLVEHGTLDPKTGLVLPAYFGSTNITGDIAKQLNTGTEISDKVSYVTRCSRCFTRPRYLTEYLQ
jgi:thymidine kinase